MNNLNKLLKKIREDSTKLQENLDFFIQAYEGRCLEEEDKKGIKEDIRYLRKDLNDLMSNIDGILIIHKR